MSATAPIREDLSHCSSAIAETPEFCCNRGEHQAVGRQLRAIVTVDHDRHATSNARDSSRRIVGISVIIGYEKPYR